MKNLKSIKNANKKKKEKSRQNILKKKGIE